MTAADPAHRPTTTAPGPRPGSGPETVAARVLADVPRDRRALVAIDGIGASGKTTLAARLAAHVVSRPTVVLHADDFFHPAEVRHARGRMSAEGFWLDAYDLDALTRWALVPLGADGDGLYRPASFDATSGRTVLRDPVQAPRDALVLVEGTFLHRDELAGFWDFSLYLHVPFDVSLQRMASRGGLKAEAMAGLAQRYIGAQRLYFAAARPWRRASVVVDNTGRDPLIVDGAEVRIDGGSGP